MAVQFIFFAAVGAAGYYFAKKLSKKSIFVSYRYEFDAKYKNLLTAWSENNKFKIKFDDFSNDVSVESNNAKVIKEEILEKIENSDVFICLIGKDTHKSKWVKWEVNKAKNLEIPIVAVKIKKSYESPSCLKNSGVHWVYGFTEQGILKALEDAV